MKKIFLSFLAIALTVGAVTSSAYALFSDTVKVQGITMTSGNADLKILQMDGSTLGDNLSVAQGLTGLYPGYTFSMPWTLENASLSNIPLQVNVKMNAVSNAIADSWYYLKDAIQMQVIGNGVDTGFYPLNDWYYGAGASLGTIAHGDTATYTVNFKIDSGVSNDIANKSINSVGFLLTASQ